MTVQPITRYTPPRYPDKETTRRDPLLLKNIPARWVGKTAVATVLTATTALMLSGCGYTNANIAPVFDHGGGYGRGYPSLPPGFMGDVLAPSTYISEDDACVMIAGLLNQQGIDCAVNDKTIETRVPEVAGIEAATDVRYHDGEITLDGYDPNRNIGFEFVSSDDLNGIYRDSSDDKNIIATARAIRNGLTKQNSDIVIGVFYDPISDREKNLMLQVADFIAWLKSEGII